MAQIKTYTVKNVSVKARIHGNGEISEEWIKEKVLENYNNEGPIPATVGPDIDPNTGKPKIRRERGFYLEVPNPLEVEEHPTRDIKNLDRARFVKWGNRPGIYWITSQSNCNNLKYTKTIWVKYSENEDSGNLIVITTYPVESMNQGGQNKGYLPFKAFEHELSEINRESVRNWFEDRGLIMVLSDAEADRLKDIDIEKVYNLAKSARDKTKDVGIFGAPATIPMN